MADLPFNPSDEDDATLTAIRTAADAEISRRSAIRNLCAQAVANTQQYKAAGGDPHDILTAIQQWITENQEATQ